MAANLDKDTILRAFRRMAEIASEEGFRVELLVYGGAVMVVEFQSRKMTRDIDVKVIGGQRNLFHLSTVVGNELDLEPGWLNHAVSVFASKSHEETSIFFSDDNFTVRMASPRYILAMKALALRANGSHDIEDVKYLIDRLKIRNIEELLSLTAEFYPEKTIDADKIKILKNLCLQQTEQRIPK